MKSKAVLLTLLVGLLIGALPTAAHATHMVCTDAGNGLPYSIVGWSPNHWSYGIAADLNLSWPWPNKANTNNDGVYVWHNGGTSANYVEFGYRTDNLPFPSYQLYAAQNWNGQYSQELWVGPVSAGTHRFVLYWDGSKFVAKLDGVVKYNMPPQNGSSFHYGYQYESVELRNQCNYGVQQFTHNDYMTSDGLWHINTGTTYPFVLNYDQLNYYSPSFYVNGSGWSEWNTFCSISDCNWVD